MKIAIAGGAGYVGSVLGNHLMASGHEVLSLDRLLYSQSQQRKTHRRFDTLDIDIRDIRSEQLEGFDAVINLAGFSNDPTAEYDPAANMALNCDAAVDLLSAAYQAGVRRYVLASSASVYDGCPAATDGHLCLEDDDLLEYGLMLPYSRSKRCAELELAAVAGTMRDMSVVVLRKGTVHGFSPRMRFDLVVNIMTAHAVTDGRVEVHQHPDGSMYRPIVDVGDVATAYEKACEIELLGTRMEIFNICNENYSVTEIAANVVSTVQHYSGRTVRLDVTELPEDRHFRSYRMSAHKARAVLGWTPVVTLQSSVETLVARFGSNDMKPYHPIHNNIAWMKIIRGIEDSTLTHGPILTGRV